MYVIAGATGRVGSATAQHLLATGEEIRVLVRTQNAADHWAQREADTRVIDLGDRAALGEALVDCRGFFTLLPFDLGVDDLDAHAAALVDSIAGAVSDEQVPHVVMLSSGGADLAEGTGPIAGHYRLEQALLATGTTLTALRSGHFQEKVAEVIDLARSSRIYPVFSSSADSPLSMVATADIGAVAASFLRSVPVQSGTVDIVGPSYSEREIAGLLGAALGQELQVAVIPEAAWVASLRDAGFRPHIAESLAELYRADERGLLAPRGDRAVEVSTPIETTIAKLLAGHRLTFSPDPSRNLV